MSLKPILFNTEMVCALLEGRKTVTRRVVKPQPEGRPVPLPADSCWPGYFAIQGTERVVRPPYQHGDVLYVRETWAKNPFGGGYIYPTEVAGAGQKWRPSIHMPRKAARIFLRVTSVWVERLQAITEQDAKDEGACKAYDAVRQLMSVREIDRLGGELFQWNGLMPGKPDGGQTAEDMAKNS